jgi:hypothetical protein
MMSLTCAAQLLGTIKFRTHSKVDVQMFGLSTSTLTFSTAAYRVTLAALFVSHTACCVLFLDGVPHFSALYNADCFYFYLPFL